MPRQRYQRLKTEHVQPVDALIPRAKARELLIDYLMQIGFPQPYADSCCFMHFDPLADAHDQRLDDAFESATSGAELDVAMSTGEVGEVTAALRQARTPSDTKSLEAELRTVQKELAKAQAVIDKAEAKRTAGKADYRKMLLKAAARIVSEEEKM